MYDVCDTDDRIKHRALYMLGPQPPKMTLINENMYRIHRLEGFETVKMSSLSSLAAFSVHIPNTALTYIEIKETKLREKA